jgi:AcrR family transcriptional regulator
MNNVQKSFRTKMNDVQHKNEHRSKMRWQVAGKRETKKEELKARLVAAGTDLIQEQGLKSLRARDIAERAGAALGGLYTVFDDLDGLILHVNSGTLKRLETALNTAVRPAAGIEETFLSLSLAYLRFALAERNLWSALFEHRMPEGVAVPEWHVAEHAFLIGLIAAPLARQLHDASPEDVAIRARTFFAAVHGVISLSLEGRFIGITPEVLEREVTALAGILARSGD